LSGAALDGVDLLKYFARAFGPQAAEVYRYPARLR
jgi:hypothetical protein